MQRDARSYRRPAIAPTPQWRGLPPTSPRSRVAGPCSGSSATHVRHWLTNVWRIKPPQHDVVLALRRSNPAAEVTKQLIDAAEDRNSPWFDVKSSCFLQRNGNI